MDDLPVAPPTPARRRLFIAITLVVVAALVVVGALEGSGFILRTDPGPDVAPTTNPASLAHLAVIGLDGGLSSMDADGGSVAGYPAPDVAFQFPAWSPDGTRIAAIGTGSDGTSLDVFQLPVGGAPAPAPTVAYESLDHPAFYLYWAPDGKALAFLTTEPNGISLRHVPADASSVATTVRQGAPMYWQWADPARLLVHSGADAPDGFVGEVGLDGAVTAPTTMVAGSFRAPALSDDGTYIAYTTSGQNGLAQLVVDSRDGAAHHEVPVHSLAAFEFEPGGDDLAFTAADTAGASLDIPVGPLRVIDPTTGVVRTLLDGSIVTFFWAPDGQTIAAIRVSGPGDTKVASARDRAAVPGATLARAGTLAAQTAAGVELRITFVDVASGAIRSERVGRVSDLFINQVLPFFDQYALSHRFWSPDSKSIVLPIDDDQGVSQIEIIPADGSDARVVARGLIATWSP